MAGSRPGLSLDGTIRNGVAEGPDGDERQQRARVKAIAATISAERMPAMKAPWNTSDKPGVG
jgi:hypothetical protein